jgi:hypothetical protein
MDTIHGICDDSRILLYLLLAGADGGPTVRAAQQARDEERADSFRRIQAQVVEVAKERLSRREFEREKNAPQEAYEGVHVEEFAERAARRLKTVADRLERSGSLEDDGKILARAQELRVAAKMMRDEAKVVARKASAEDEQEQLSQQPRSQTRFVSEPVYKE